MYVFFILQAPDWIGSILAYIIYDLHGCDEQAALAAVDKGLALCLEDEYADQEVGPAAYLKLKNIISHK